MQALEYIGHYYIQGSLACSFLAVIFSVVVALTMKDPLPKYVIIMSRMMMIFILGFTLAAVGYIIGVLYMSWIQIPGTSIRGYETFGGSGMIAGMLLGVTLGWIYAFWPMLRATHPSPRQQPTERNHQHAQDEYYQ